jgi:hypothetical protein
MMNHLLIGLGGTGGRVLRSFRKLSYQAFRDKPPANVTIDYLFVDSDPKSFREDDPSWTVLGRSVNLPKRSQLPIQQANLRAVIDDLNSHPNLKPWIGDRQSWGEVLASMNIDAAGGQKRRLGRFLFAMSARRFNDSISTLVREMQDRGKSTDTTFHIFTGLAGGTGSGSVVDAVAQIRKLFPDSHQRIIVYAYLPDMNPPSNWNTGNYHANAYAALLELNSMAAGAWAPFDVVDGVGPVKRDFWFNGCYVFTDDNDQGYRASIEGELTDILADFVYHKIVVARQVSWDDLSRFENSENGDSSPESIAGSGKGQRSVRFMSFGIRRLSFPEETIREYLTYDFMVQALRQLQHNNWLDGLGFSDQPRPRADAEFVANPKQREDWCLTDDHLFLTRPIIETEASKRWKSIEIEWQDWENHYISLAKQQVNKIDWLKEVKTLFRTAYEQNYRGSGVRQFFATYDRDIKNLSIAIRDRVERSLFNDWRVGTCSLSEASRIVEALLRDLSARREVLETNLTRRGQIADELLRQFTDLERRWPQIGLIGSLLGNYEKNLTQAGFLLRDGSIANTYLEALRFAKRLIAEVSDQLTELKSMIDSSQATLASAADEAVRTMKARAPSRDSNSLMDKTAESGSYVLKLEDGKAIDTTRRKLSLDENEQRTQTSTVRAGIISALGQEPTFRVFNSRLAGSEIRNTILAMCEENVESAHQRLITDRTERVLDVSIIEKLQQEWGASLDRINREASSLARSAGRFLAFDETEINKHFDGRSGSPRATEAFAIMLPEPPEQKEFVNQLKEAFKNARNGKVSFVPMQDRGNEITLITLVNLFPLRFARVVRTLKERYQQRIDQYGRARTMLEVHSEGDGSQFPDIFIADGGSIRVLARPVLLLGEALDVVSQKVSPSTGQTQVIITRKDADGFELEPIVLGKSLISALEEITEKDLYELKQTLIPLLLPPHFAKEEEMVELREKLQSRMAAIKSERLDDVNDPEYVAWNQAARDVMKIARKEGTL